MSVLRKAFHAVAGGDPRENYRRWEANQELRSIIENTQPWTREALRFAVAEWLRMERDS